MIEQILQLIIDARRTIHYVPPTFKRTNSGRVQVNTREFFHLLIHPLDFEKLRRETLERNNQHYFAVDKFMGNTIIVTLSVEQGKFYLI